MKAEIIENETKRFKPFSFIIKVENEEDLRNLWHRFNINNPDKFGGGHYIKTPRNFCNKGNTWDLLNKKAHQFNLGK